jgi:ABC-2 type transport system ATP-binding protein
MSVLELIDLKHSYGYVTALDGLSFAVQDGEMLGFVGPNGAGKTTAMRVVLGLLDPVQARCAGAGRPSRTRSDGASVTCRRNVVSIRKCA